MDIALIYSASQAESLDDGYSWRKYGEKVIPGVKYPMYDHFLSCKNHITYQLYMHLLTFITHGLCSENIISAPTVGHKVA